jgi:hypothetical protein
MDGRRRWPRFTDVIPDRNRRFDQPTRQIQARNCGSDLKQHAQQLCGPFASSAIQPSEKGVISMYEWRGLRCRGSQARGAARWPTARSISPGRRATDQDLTVMRSYLRGVAATSSAASSLCRAGPGNPTSKSKGLVEFPACDANGVKSWHQRLSKTTPTLNAETVLNAPGFELSATSVGFAQTWRASVSSGWAGPRSSADRRRFAARPCCPGARPARWSAVAPFPAASAPGYPTYCAD